MEFGRGFGYMQVHKCMDACTQLDSGLDWVYMDACEIYQLDWIG